MKHFGTLDPAQASDAKTTTLSAVLTLKLTNQKASLAQGRDLPIFKNYSLFGFLTRFLTG
jgi:hypothetical protein